MAETAKADPVRVLPRYRLQRREDGDYVGFSLEADPAGPLCKWKEIEHAQFFAALAQQAGAVGGECSFNCMATMSCDNSCAPQPAIPARPSDDELWDQTLRERDRYHDVADELAGLIAQITGVDIGEHSSANCPWKNAIEAAEEYKPQPAIPEGWVPASVLRDLLRHVDAETCTHEETHRGGAIWTICDGCGAKWSDDRNPFTPHVDAPAVAAAREVIAQHNREGE